MCHKICIRIAVGGSIDEFSLFDGFILPKVFTSLSIESAATESRFR